MHFATVDARVSARWQVDEGKSRGRRVDGDEGESLVQVKPYEFKYTQTEQAGDTVKLIFSLTNYPDIMDTLDVTIVDQRQDGE